MFQDITLECADCGSSFIFTVGEQEFYASKGLVNTPKRCNECRNKRKQSFSSRKAEKRMYDVICSECGAEAQVPFRPQPDKPVLCRDCFTAKQV